MDKVAKCAIGVFAVFSAVIGHADYYWIANDGDYHLWADASNWATSANGATPAASCPNADSDGVYALSSGGMKMFVDLGGGDYTIKEWSFSSAGAGQAAAFTNGTLTVSSGTSDSSIASPVEVVDATLVFNGTMDIGKNYGWSGANYTVWTLHDGGNVFVNGDFYPRWLQLEINEGGRFVYGSTARGCNCNRNGDFPINVNGGSLEFVGGFNRYNAAWSFRPLIKMNSGAWIIGGKIGYANNIYFRIELVGGTVSATNDVEFQIRNDAGNTAAYAKFMPTADVTLNVVAGKTMDMAKADATHVPFSYEPGSDGTNYTAITRTGVGTLLLADVPYSLDLQSGTTTFSANTRTAMGTLKVAAGQSFTLPNADTTIGYISNAGTVTIGAPGLSIGGIAAGGSVASGTFAINGATFSEGDTILTTSDSALRAKVKADLEAVGVNVAESGETLTVGANELVFNGGDGGATTDINEPTAWKSGSVPPAGATVMVASNVTAEITAAGEGIPAWAVIVVQDGATLRVSKATTLPEVHLEGTAVLEVAADSTMANGFVCVVDGAKVPSLTVANGATLAVPGGTTFGGVSLSIDGTLAATTAGNLVLGYAANGETLPFGLSVAGGTISTTSGNINFACPDSGGTVTALGGAVWTITSASLTPDPTHAFNFGMNNPAAQVISVELSGTTLNYPKGGSFYYQGGVSVKFSNSSALIKANRGNDGDADSALYVENRARLVFNDSELYWGAGRMDGSVGNGPFYLKPDEDGWQSLALTNSVFFYHHLTSNHKAAIVVSNATYTAEYSTYNYRMPFRGTLVNDSAVAYNAGYAVLNGDLTIRRKDSDSRTASMSMPANVPCSGTGGIHIAKPSGFNAIAFTINNGANTATGRLTADDGCTITLGAGANWAGTVDYADNVTIADLGGATASEITVGGLNLAKPLVYRVWEDSNDKINFTGEGIVPNGRETQILLQNGYEPAPGTVVELGTVPADFDLLSVINSNTKWTYSLASIENDAAHKTLRAVVANVDYTFDGGSGETPVVDLSDVGGWRCGTVPVGQDVAIDGVAAVATGEVPSFHSITLKNGASLAIQRSTGEEEYTGTTLPAVELRAGTSLTVSAGAIAAISGALTTYVASGEENSLPHVTVAEGGELSVPGGTTFGGVSLSVAGTLATTTVGDLVLGYAAPGETLPFALAVRDGTISNAFGNINFVCPANGGTVTAPTALVLTNATLKTASAYAYNFGVNNPAPQIIDIVFDDTTLLYPDNADWATVPKIIGGGVKMTFTNGASLFRGNGETRAELTIRECAQLVFNSGTSFKFGHSKNAESSSGNGKVTIDPSEGVSSIVLNDGATMDIYREDGTSKSVLEVHGMATREKGYAGWNVAHPFINYKEVNLADAGSVLKFTWPSSYSEGWVDDYLKVRAKNQVIDNIPFVGLGSFVVDNDHLSGAKTLTLKGVNTATGSLSVVPEKNVTLILDNGFGWAGTVVAGNIVLTNLTGGAAAATATFSTLDLSADFPIRVWKDGSAFTSDALTVGAFINDGGRLVPTMMTEGAEFANGDALDVGLIGKSSPLPKVKTGWIAKHKAIDGNDDYDALVLKKGVGLQVILR